MKSNISIIICNYNNQRYLERCLDSIYSQTININKYKVIFVDDASTDSSLSLISKYFKKKNFTLIKNKKNLGLIKSCNKALERCHTKYFIRVDSDDYVSKLFISKFLKEIKKNYDFIFSNYYIVKKRKTKKIKFKNNKIFNLISCSIAMKVNFVKKIGKYRNMFWEEYDLYIRYLNKYHKVKKLKDYLYYYRRHQSNMTNSKKNIKLGWAKLYSKHNLNKIKKINLNFNDNLVKNEK